LKSKRQKEGYGEYRKMYDSETLVSSFGAKTKTGSTSFFSPDLEDFSFISDQKTCKGMRETPQLTENVLRN